MGALFILIPVSLILGGIALGLFIWAGKKGQFDDIEGPKYRMLNDDDDEK
jgi:cbb3-type cytochrome oxidase maturation protein